MPKLSRGQLKFDNTRINVRIVYTKNEYNHKVKVEGWTNWELSQPFDTDPLCLVKNNFHSHYKKFGECHDEWVTTTSEALNQITKRRKSLEVNREPSIYNVHTFISDVCEKKEEVCHSKDCRRYKTTMQFSYVPPYSKIQQSIYMKKVPFNANRFVSQKSNSTFLDDGYVDRVKILQKQRKSQHVSYNPCTGKYTDGTTKD